MVQTKEGPSTDVGDVSHDGRPEFDDATRMPTMLIPIFFRLEPSSRRSGAHHAEPES